MHCSYINKQNKLLSAIQSGIIRLSLYDCENEHENENEIPKINTKNDLV